MKEMLHPSKVGVPHRGGAVLPPLILPELLSLPIRHVERGICQDVVSFKVWVPVVPKTVPRLNMGLNAADRQVHLGKPVPLAFPPFPFPEAWASMNLMN